MSECALCEAKDAQIVRLLSRQDTIDHARAKARVVELEETLARMNRAQPQKVAIEVCRELARTDPRDMETLRCVWCGRDSEVSGGNHAGDCAWQQAVAVAKKAEKRETEAVVERWRAG